MEEIVTFHVLDTKSEEYHVPTFKEIIDVPAWVLIVWDVFGLPQYVMPVEEEENE